jgi:putative holliday junction resolvase
MGRVLGVDHGTKRVGLAVSDPMRATAQPLDVVTGTGSRDLLDRVADAVAEWDAEEIVVGLPLHMDGTEGASAEAARRFAGALRERTGLPVVLWDERLSSVEAERDMRSAGVTAKGQRGSVDKVAAALVLRSYLEAHRTPTDADA